MNIDHQSFLRATITERVFVPHSKEPSIAAEGFPEENPWFFELKRVFLDPKVLRSVAALFWERFASWGPLQIGGMELTAVPLVTALVMEGEAACPGVTGFIVRKSRKREGLMRMFEGEVSDEKIILVDDAINSGKSFIRQIEALSSLGKRVEAVFTVLRLRDLPYYAYLNDRGIRIESLFTLDDFKEMLPVAMLRDTEQKSVPMPFRTEWVFKSKNPAYYHVLPKSAPAIDDERLYFGTDNKVFWALNQKDGSVAWMHHILFSSRGKAIFSSPALLGDSVFFGAYDGNFYALDKKTGKRNWVYMEADWIGSSPAVAADLNLVFVGLEFGLKGKRGGLVALNARTGEKQWLAEMPLQTHASPAYFSREGIVACGSDEGKVCGFDARSGALRWEVKTDGAIKAGIAFDESRGLAAFGSLDRNLYVVDAATGAVVWRFPVLEWIYSTPLFCGNLVYATSLDKHLYCFDVETGREVWKFRTSGRIFSSPVMAEGKLYIGSNDGRFYELNPETGRETGFFQSVERIVNATAYNADTKRFFVPTFAGEIYCLSKDPEGKRRST